MAQSIGNPTQLWKTHLALARVAAGRHRADRARQEWEAAREVIDRVRDSLRHPGLRASFVSSPMIRQALEFEAPR